MYEKNNRSRWRRWIGLGVTAGLICTVGLACKAKSSGPSDPPRSSAEGRTAVDDGSNVQADASPSSETKTPPRVSVHQPAQPVRPTRPLTRDVIASLRAQIQSAASVGERIRARRGLVYQLSRIGETDLASEAFEGFLEEVEQQEGSSRAELAGMILARLLDRRFHLPSAIAAYERILNGWPDGHSTAEALYRLGMARSRSDQFGQAIDAFQRLIQEHDDSKFAPYAWQEMASAQQFLGDMDASLATLDVLAVKYEGTQFEEDARIRRGEILEEAGRIAEARIAYGAFLSEKPQSRQSAKVREKLRVLNATAGLVRGEDATGEGSAGDVHP